MPTATGDSDKAIRATLFTWNPGIKPVKQPRNIPKINDPINQPKSINQGSISTPHLTSIQNCIVFPTESSVVDNLPVQSRGPSPSVWLASVPSPSKQTLSSDPDL